MHDGESRVKVVVKKGGAELRGFARFQLGEGIEKQVDDFAAEVAKVSGVPNDGSGDLRDESAPL